ncbi:MAG: ABC transporter ATP-binding protein [Firmicutes bacterium]|nr:ABC transporter ATP-binding protein [Bacillota bacterium]
MQLILTGLGEVDSVSKLLEVRNLKTHFETEEGTVKAVNGVTFDIHRGQTLGVVGESGCGKSVTAQSILRIEGARGKIVEGDILFYPDPKGGDPVNIAKLDSDGQEIRAIRGKEISIIFQEPMTSFCPVYTIGNQIMESIILHQKAEALQARERAVETLRLVGIPKPEERIDEYPHRLSGGLRQRAMIAMALSCHPQLLIADEPTTALDVTIQAQILELMRELQREMGMAIMLITHSLGVIAEMAQRVIVMYLGRIVEDAEVNELFDNPKHPYTRALMYCVPRLGSGIERLQPILGSVPDPYNIPTGCSFYPRCPEFIEGLCDVEAPTPVKISENHSVSCFLYGKGGAADGSGHTD